MQDSVEKKISDADNISKSEITDKIKSEHSDRYDQMIVSSEIERNDVLYINYKAQYLNLSTQKIVFAMTEDVSLDFHAHCTGGEGAHGEVSELSDSVIRVIKDSKALIAEKSMGDGGEPSSLKNAQTLQFLSKGFMDSKEAAATEDPAKAKEESSVFGSISKILNEPIGGSDDDDDDDDDDDYEDVFETIDWFGPSAGGELESSQYEYVKNRSFKNLTFEYNGDTLSKKQPLFFVPYLTKAEDCKACKGEAKVQCPTCKGTGKLKCKGQVKTNPNGGPVSNIHYSCKNGILQDGKSSNCETCGGPEKIGGRGGWNPCERKYGSKYGIGKLAAAVTGKPYCGQKDEFPSAGVIPCKPCKATGQIGTLVYIKPRVGELEGEFFQYTNQKIEQIEKKPNTLYPYLNKSNVRMTTVFSDTNGSLNDNYDRFSSGFVSELQTTAGVHKGQTYPRLMHEEVYYDIIPLATLEYNHILTATNHLVSAVAKGREFDVLFHADGNIAEEEKMVLANTITGMTEYTATEKSKLFSLMSSKSLPELTDNDFVISTRERADITFQRLDEMAMEDAQLEKPEGILVKEYKERINANIGRYQGKFKQFLKTWQVSLSVLVMILTGIYSAFFFMYLKPRQDALKLHTQNIQNEKILGDFIAWTGKDTTKNLQFSNFLMDLSISNSENSDFDMSIRELKPLQLLDKMDHQSEYLVEGSKVTYKDYWKEHTGWLRTSLDSLMPILERRIAAQEKPVAEETETTEEFVEDGLWYTVSDPDGFSNLRETPDGEVLQEIYEGQLFEVIGVKGAYKKVRLEDGVTEGYIYSSRIVLFEGGDGVVDEPTGDGYEEEGDGSEELDPEYQ
ncbi:MAG: hypothetical protein LW688_13295 [Cryomorphaceae bacterium]|nr:hypothetical protein [Cryomorphaceae bacterium]